MSEVPVLAVKGSFGGGQYVQFQKENFFIGSGSRNLLHQPFCTKCSLFVGTLDGGQGNIAEFWRM